MEKLLGHRNTGRLSSVVLETPRIECGREVIASYPVKTDYLETCPRDSSDVEPCDN